MYLAHGIVDKDNEMHTQVREQEQPSNWPMEFHLGVFWTPKSDFLNIEGNTRNL